jgi:hypothetical protein
MGCSEFWDQMERFFLASAIQKAEARLEADRWLGFPVRRKYEKPRQLEYSSLLHVGKYVRGLGVETEVFVQPTTMLVVLATLFDHLA